MVVCVLLVAHAESGDRSAREPVARSTATETRMQVGMDDEPEQATAPPTAVSSANQDPAAASRVASAPVSSSASAASALAAAMPSTIGHLSVAVFDPATGEIASSGGERTYVTASIVKVDILAALLLRAQDEGRSLTAAERTTAAAMIRNSDNTATDTLWGSIGGAAALRAANVRLGLTETVPTEASWGLTATTVGDQVRLLNAVTADSSALTARSRAYIEDLMTSVADDQAWGVSTVADAGTDTALKNGWLPRDATGLWVINSIGRVTHDGRTLMVAVLSDDQASMAAGIDQVEAVVEAVVPAVTDALN
ncbi:serine hydrolase [Streptomyces sp. SID3343]|uniref:serine hydrolase n=1 Tax=Streptomyces sp. SID3343 TaxID=2690260 RepID=UPI0031F85F70